MAHFYIVYRNSDGKILKHGTSTLEGNVAYQAGEGETAMCVPDKIHNVIEYRVNSEGEVVPAFLSRSNVISIIVSANLQIT